MKFKAGVLTIQVIFSAYLFYVCIPNLDQNPKYEAIMMATLAYWFPSPISNFPKENQ